MHSQLVSNLHCGDPSQIREFHQNMSVNGKIIFPCILCTSNAISCRQFGFEFIGNVELDILYLSKV